MTARILENWTLKRTRRNPSSTRNRHPSLTPTQWMTLNGSWLSRRKRRRKNSLNQVFVLSSPHNATHAQPPPPHRQTNPMPLRLPRAPRTTPEPSRNPAELLPLTRIRRIFAKPGPSSSRGPEGKYSRSEQLCHPGIGPRYVK